MDFNQPGKTQTLDFSQVSITSQLDQILGSQFRQFSASICGPMSSTLTRNEMPQLRFRITSFIYLHHKINLLFCLIGTWLDVEWTSFPIHSITVLWTLFSFTFVAGFLEPKSLLSQVNVSICNIFLTDSGQIDSGGGYRTVQSSETNSKRAN